MADLPDFQKKQYAFAAHIRDPDHVPAPEGIEDRRMGVYRHLFFNNLRNLLGGMFPVLRKILTSARWDTLIRQFMQQHQSATPYFLQLPEEFVNFLQNEYEPKDDDLPFLTELAHYEYIEIALSISEAANDLDGVDPDGDLVSGVPVKSELCWTYAYRYPVHRIAVDFLPDKPSDAAVFLAVYRDSNDKVRFLELNAVTAGLLDAIENNHAGRTGEQLLRTLATDINYPDASALLAHGTVALEELRQLEILTGARHPA
jgi:hypothetical protein